MYILLRRSARRLGRIYQLKTINLFAVKSFSSVVDFISFFFFFFYSVREMDDIVYPPVDSTHHSRGEMLCAVQGSLFLYYHFGVLFCFNLIFCSCDAIPFLGSAAPTSCIVADQSLCVQVEEISLYIWTRACPPLFACLFRLDVIRRKETNSDLISITFCDDATLFFLPPLPFFLRAWLIFIRKKKRWPSLQFPY